MSENALTVMQSVISEVARAFCPKPSVCHKCRALAAQILDKAYRAGVDDGRVGDVL